VKTLRLEWEDYGDRFRRLLAKIAKRSKASESPETDDLPAPKPEMPPTVNPLAERLLRGRGETNGVLPR